MFKVFFIVYIDMLSLQSELVATARANLKCLHDVLNKWRVEVPDLKVELKSVQSKLKFFFLLILLFIFTWTILP